MNNGHKHTTIAFHKPYGVLSQFTRETGKRSLADFGPFPRDVYPVGRLDAESEGLLILTNDNGLKALLTHPRHECSKTYVVQIERVPSDTSLQKLGEGIVLKGKKTRPATVRLLEKEPEFPQRTVPIRFRKTVPTSWLEISITEGRNRQIRHMTAAMGHPTLRLIRVKIGTFALGDLQPGENRELTEDEVGLLKR